MKKLFTLAFLVIIGIVVSYGQKIQNDLFNPILIENSETVIVLEDYFPDIKDTAYRLVHIPEGMDIQEGNYELTLHGEPDNEIDFVEVSISFLNYVIPVIREKTYNKESAKSLKQTAFHSKSKELEIYTHSTIENALILIDNKRVKSEEISYLANSIKVKIPTNLRMMNISNLRAYMYNGGLLQLDIPLYYGVPRED